MKKVAIVLLMGVALMGLGILNATAQEQEEVKTLKGTVVKVDEQGVVTVKVEDKEVTVTTDDKTAVTIDSKEAKVADLKADMTVVVTPAEGTATKIEATSPVTTLPAEEQPAEEQPAEEKPSE